MKEGANVYSRRWSEFFHANIDQARTSREADFVCACAPVTEFPRILDAWCGMGRHARELSRRGYKITGIDRDPGAIAKAREFGGSPNYVVADIREYQFTLHAFDAAIVMGQSFGHFDAATNRDILFRLASSIPKRARILLDLWNPEFFKAHQGQRDLETSRGIVREIKRFEDSRLFVQLTYPDEIQEKFEWQLFTPEQMEQSAKAVGLRLVTSCSGFDAKSMPSPGDPRIQFVLQREANE
jgi:SAM-dependent methyltransferase